MSIPSLPDNPPLLVGRERELSVLRQHLDAAIAGRGGLVLIGGEAGIGKTALAEAVCREATGKGALVLVGRCYDLSETPPYGPWIELFGQYQRSEGPPLPDAFAPRGLVGDVRSQTALFHQVLDSFAAVAIHRPLVLLLDDLHWSDPASLDLLRFLARSLVGKPLLLLATYRADELTRRHPLSTLLPALVREADAHRLTLHPLTVRDIAALVAQRYALSQVDEARLTAYLHTRSEGNPFFLSELLHTIEDEQVVERSGGAWRLKSLTAIRVPSLLRQVIDGRIARLGDTAQPLLEWAAIIGHDVPLALWSAASTRDHDMLLTLVEQAVTVRLMDAASDGQSVRFVHALTRETLYEGILPTRRQTQHRVVGEMLAALPKPDPDAVAYHLQQAGDERAAEWLVTAGNRAALSSALLTAADRYEVALALLTTSNAGSGERGWLFFCIATMRRHSEPKRGIACLEAAEQLAREAGDIMLLTAISGLLGLLHCMVGEVRQGLAEMEASLAARQSLSSEDLFTEFGYISGAVLNPAEQTEAVARALRIRGEGTLLMRYAGAGRFADALTLSARYVGDDAPPTLPSVAARLLAANWADAFYGLATTYAAMGSPEAARDFFRRATAAYRSTGNFVLILNSRMRDLLWVVLPYQADRLEERRRLATFGAEAVVRARGARGDIPERFAHLPVLVLEGLWEEAHTIAVAMHAGTTGVSHHKQVADAVLGPLARARGDTELAWSVVCEWFPHGPATELGNSAFLTAIALQRTATALCLDAGDLVTAKEWLEAHDRWLTWSGAVLGQSDGQALWAQYYCQMGEMEQAFDHAARALAHATAPRQPVALIAAHRLLGEIATDAERFDDAATHLDASLALADACAAPYERAITLLAHAELLIATDNHAGAMMLLDEVRSVCRPLGAQPALVRVDALAARLSAQAGSAPSYPASLSAREVEVLRLLVQGMSNRAIATHLFVSVRTVERHIGNLYTKIGAHNRADATAFAFRHNLT